MTLNIKRMAVFIRRELVAWAFVGLALRWVWLHGFDKWAFAFALAAAGIHPLPRKDTE